MTASPWLDDHTGRRPTFEDAATRAQELPQFSALHHHRANRLFARSAPHLNRNGLSLESFRGLCTNC